MDRGEMFLSNLQEHFLFAHRRASPVKFGVDRTCRAHQPRPHACSGVYCKQIAVGAGDTPASCASCAPSRPCAGGVLSCMVVLHNKERGGARHRPTAIKTRQLRPRPVSGVFVRNRSRCQTYSPCRRAALLTSMSKSNILKTARQSRAIGLEVRSICCP